jgi:hypothetical protein
MMHCDAMNVFDSIMITAFAVAATIRVFDPISTPSPIVVRPVILTPLPNLTLRPTRIRRAIRYLVGRSLARTVPKNARSDICDSSLDLWESPELMSNCFEFAWSAPRLDSRSSFRPTTIFVPVTQVDPVG